MTTDKRLDKFEKLVSNKPSNFLSKFAEYKENQKWLDKSSEIAVNILEALKDKNLSQKDLAKKLEISAQQVSKIVKGQQNLTLETICKIETALEMSLMEIKDYNGLSEIKVSSTQIKAVQKKLIEELKPIRTHKSIETINFTHKVSSMTIAYKKNELTYPATPIAI
jgi:transcriptional regulator with XRE-family HTH domain